MSCPIKNHSGIFRIDIYTIFVVPNEDKSLGLDIPWHNTLLNKDRANLLRPRIL